jgi:hypothetical protein
VFANGLHKLHHRAHGSAHRRRIPCVQSQIIKFRPYTITQNSSKQRIHYSFVPQLPECGIANRQRKITSVRPGCASYQHSLKAETCRLIPLVTKYDRPCLWLACIPCASTLQEAMNSAPRDGRKRNTYSVIEIKVEKKRRVVIEIESFSQLISRSVLGCLDSNLASCAGSIVRCQQAERWQCDDKYACSAAAPRLAFRWKRRSMLIDFL